MRKLTAKIPAMIAMVISLFSFALLIASLIVSFIEVPPEMGVSRSFALWVYAVLVAMLSLIFYTVDAVLSIVKVFRKNHPVFNAVLAVTLIAGIPFFIFIGGGLGINIYIWAAYYLLMFVLESVSIIKRY